MPRPKKNNADLAIVATTKPTFRDLLLSPLAYVTGSPDSVEYRSDGTIAALCCPHPQHHADGSPDATPSFKVKPDQLTGDCYVCRWEEKKVLGVDVAGYVKVRLGLATYAAACEQLRSHGLTIGTRSAAPDWNDVFKTYEYFDENEELQYQVGRWQHEGGKKTFRPRAVGPNGSWVYNLDGVPRIPYNLPAVLATAAAGGTIYVVEGEKDADTLTARGLCATTNAGGTGFVWPEAWADYFAGASRVVVIADNDSSGTAAARDRGSKIVKVVPDTRVIVALPGVKVKGDVSDWLEDPANTVEQLDRTPYEVPEPYVPEVRAELVFALLDDLTDVGNARWFVATEGDHLRYLTDRKVWLRADNGIWLDEPTIGSWALSAVDKMERAAALCTDPRVNEFQKNVKASRSRNKLSAMVALAEDLRGVQLTSASLDTKLYFLGVANGIVDLRTGKLYPPNPAMYLTKRSPYTYDPSLTEADCSTYIANCLHDAMRNADGVDEEMVDCLDLVSGEALFGLPKIRRWYFFYGPSGSRKTTTTEVWQRVMGPYAQSVNIASISEQWKSSGSAPSPDIMRMRGARLIIVPESKETDRLDPARIKLIVGGDEIVARNLNEGPIAFRCVGTLIVYGNDRPKLDGDESVWSKLKMFGFKNQIPNGQQDLQYVDKLLEREGPAILAHMVRQSVRLHERDYQLPEPTAMRAELDAYRQSQNTVADFMEEATEPADARIKPLDLYVAYKTWCRMKFGRNSRDELGRGKFNSKVNAEYGVPKVIRGCDYRVGMRLKQDFERRMRQHGQETEF